jgi:hypothetical protein
MIFFSNFSTGFKSFFSSIKYAWNHKMLFIPASLLVLVMAANARILMLLQTHSIVAKVMLQIPVMFLTYYFSIFMYAYVKESLESSTGLFAKAYKTVNSIVQTNIFVVMIITVIALQAINLYTSSPNPLTPNVGMLIVNMAAMSFVGMYFMGVIFKMLFATPKNMILPFIRKYFTQIIGFSFSFGTIIILLAIALILPTQLIAQANAASQPILLVILAIRVIPIMIASFTGIAAVMHFLVVSYKKTIETSS